MVSKLSLSQFALCFPWFNLSCFLDLFSASSISHILIPAMGVRGLLDRT